MAAKSAALGTPGRRRKTVFPAVTGRSGRATGGLSGSRCPPVVERDSERPDVARGGDAADDGILLKIE